MSGSPFPIRRRETTNVPLEQRRVRCSTSQEGSPPRVQAVWGRRSRRRKGRAPLTEGSRQSAEQGHSVPYGTPVMTVIVTLCPCGPPPAGDVRLSRWPSLSPEPFWFVDSRLEPAFQQHRTHRRTIQYTNQRGLGRRREPTAQSSRTSSEPSTQRGDDLRSPSDLRGSVGLRCRLPERSVVFPFTGQLAWSRIWPKPTVH